MSSGTPTQQSSSSNGWDATAYDRLSEPQYEWGQRVLSRLELRGDEAVVDAGCATGRAVDESLGNLALYVIPDGGLPRETMDAFIPPRTPSRRRRRHSPTMDDEWYRSPATAPVGRERMSLASSSASSLINACRSVTRASSTTRWSCYVRLSPIVRPVPVTRRRVPLCSWFFVRW